MIQIQAVVEADTTIIFGLDKEGQVWRGLPQRKGQKGYEIKWLRVAEAESARAPEAVGPRVISARR